MMLPNDRNLTLGTFPTHDEPEYAPEVIAAFVRDVDDARDASIKYEFDTYGGTLPLGDWHWLGGIRAAAEKHGIPWPQPAKALYVQARREGRTHTRLSILKAVG